MGVWGAQIDEEKKPELSLQSGGHDNILMKSLPNKVSIYSSPVSVLTLLFFCRQMEIDRLCQL